MLSWIGNQGVLGALERMLGHTVTTPTTFVIVLTVGAVGLAVAAAAYRRSSPVLGLLVVEATESLASPVSWSHHFIWVVLLVAWLALAEDRPRYGEWCALGVAVLFWAAPDWWVPHGPGVTFAGRGWLIPLSDSYVLLFIALVVGAGVRVVRAHGRAAPARRPAGDGAVGRRHLSGAASGAQSRPGSGSQTQDERVGPGSSRRVRRRLRVGHPPAGHDHELLGVAGPELVAPRLADRLARSRSAAARSARAAGRRLGCHQEGGHEHAARRGPGAQRLAHRPPPRGSGRPTGLRRRRATARRRRARPLERAAEVAASPRSRPT